MIVALTHQNLLDGTKDMRVQPDTDVAFDNETGKITAIGHNLPADKKIDMTGKYLMPGLINLHVHLPGSGIPKKKSNQNPAAVKKLMSSALSRSIIRKMCYGYARQELLSGVTTIRTVGGLGQIDAQIRDKINSGAWTGPRILAANEAISVPGGHMADVLAYPAHSAEECRQLVRKVAEGKPDLIKLMITGGVLDATVRGEPGVMRMPPEYIAAACDEAHKLGFQVAAHVESPEGVRAALMGGVDTIEHGAVMDEEIIRLFKEKKAAEICTISPAVPLAHLDTALTHANDLTHYNGNIVFNGIVEGAKAALKNNIPLGLGTDTACPFVTHYDMWRELCYFVRCVGVTPAFALYTATLKNAEILHMEKEIGTVEAGKSADFVALDKNPLDDLTALRTPYLVAARGKLLMQPKIKKNALVEQALDTEMQ